MINNKSTSTFYKPIVVGFPRTGFTLLISIIIECLNSRKIEFDNKNLNHLFNEINFNLSEKILFFLKKNFSDKEILFNQNFQSLMGGPNWIEEIDGEERVCIRKYIGIKGKGDLTLIISLPKISLDFHKIPHSHGPFKFWTNYELKFASIRNSLGTINSACHSINAITSQYIQNYYSNLNDEDTELIRKDIAASKLSDENFFMAMVDPMKKSFEELIKYQNKFNIFKWEKIILEPYKSIEKILSILKIKLSTKEINDIWEILKFRNLTQAHKHNYRVGKAYVGDELESITNEHIEILKSHDFDKIHDNLGYKTLEYLDENNYNEFQKNISRAFKQKKIIFNHKDEELYWFSFQKSNIDFTKFNFKTFEWKKFTKLERTNIKDLQLINTIWEIAEETIENANDYINNQRF